MEDLEEVVKARRAEAEEFEGFSKGCGGVDVRRRSNEAREVGRKKLKDSRNVFSRVCLSVDA